MWDTLIISNQSTITVGVNRIETLFIHNYPACINFKNLCDHHQKEVLRIQKQPYFLFLMILSQVIAKSKKKSYSKFLVLLYFLSEHKILQIYRVAYPGSRLFKIEKDVGCVSESSNFLFMIGREIFGCESSLISHNVR